MPHPEDRIYVSIIELDGARHLQKISTTETGEALREAVRRSAGRATVLEFRPVKGHAEIEALAEEIRADPNWTPITPLDLAHKESGPIDPTTGAVRPASETIQ
jgi:hypothetical protein